MFHNDSGTQKCPAIYIFTQQTQVARLSQLSQIAKSKLCYKRIVIKKILSRALVGSDNHFIGTRCLSKSLELIVKPTQLFLLQILGTGAPPIWENVTPLNSANTATVSSLSFSPTVHPKFRTYTSFWQEGFVYEWFWQILENIYFFGSSGARNDCSLMTFWDFICDSATHLEWAQMRSSSYKRIEGAQRSFAIEQCMQLKWFYKKNMRLLTIEMWKWIQQSNTRKWF